MDREERSWATREIGLEGAYRLQKFLFKTEHLHYGLFEPDIPVDLANLKTAQDRYLQRLIEVIPAGTKKILDVGCGSGKTAEYLIEQGFAVDCVSPGRVLTNIAAERLGNRARIYRGKYQSVAIEGVYDLVLFSESFSYVPLDAGIGKSISLLKPGGYLLISDIFSAANESPIRGGHDFDGWVKTYKRSPLELVLERDITDQTAPLYDLIQGFMREVAQPLWDNANSAATFRWPFMSRVVRWLFRKRLARIGGRRFSPERNAATFRRDKRYKVYLFKTPMVRPALGAYAPH